MSFFCILLLFAFLPYEWAANAEDCAPKLRTGGTGTVLFNPTDVYKTCWSQDEMAILTARMILEDLIPDPKLASVRCNGDVEDYIDYFKAVIDTIRSSTKARKRHIMLLALTDLLGGYLHHALLPMARRAYYSGAVDYVFMEKLIQLYEEIKWFLRTNGQGWTKPLTISKEIRVPIIELEPKVPTQQNDSCCQKLLFYEHEPLKTKKRAISVEKGMYFPLPFFDAKFKPTAIVIPLKRFALRNIESKRAAYVVMKYFNSAERCLKEKNSKPDIVQKFQNNLYTWIDKEVIPKLNDDKFYSAFGGVLRVQNTLKALGAKVGPVSCNTDDIEEDAAAVPGVGCGSRNNKLFIAAILLFILAWFLIGTCFICYRMRNGKGTKPDDSQTKKGRESSTSFGSSKWSSIMSRSSTSKSNKQLCKCCDSTISEKSTSSYTTTSDYESEKSRNRRKPKSSGFPGKKNMSQSSPCVCPKNNDGPAVIDTKHSMKVLPSIAEISENSLTRDRNNSMKKISFADESGISSSDGGVKICAPPWAQTKNTIPCPVLSDKSTHYSSSVTTTTNKSQAAPDNDEPTPQQSNSLKRADNSEVSSREVSVKPETTEYGTVSNTPGSNMNASTSGTAEDYNYNEDEVVEEIIPAAKDVKNEPEQRKFYNYHASACHSSISGNYGDFIRKTDSDKPYVFGYDFQTSTSSDLSDDDSK